MSDYKIGDLVVLLSGSMRMGVEAVDGDHIACVWCNEGEIGRDNFDVRLVKKWEFREDLGSRARGGDDRSGDRGGNRPYRGDREGGGKPYAARDRDDRGPRGGGDRDGGGYKGDRDGGGYKGDRDGGGYKGNRDRDDRSGGGDRDKPKGKTGWDGKPREKKFFRKDD